MAASIIIKELLQWPQSKKIFSSIIGLMFTPLVLFILFLCFALDIAPSQLNILISSTTSSSIKTSSSDSILSSSSSIPISSLPSPPPRPADSFNLDSQSLPSPAPAPVLSPLVSIPPAQTSESQHKTDHQTPAAPNEEEEGDSSSSSSSNSWCDMFYGNWVFDASMEPYYPVNSCPYVDESFNCHNNGRKDTKYLKYRWKPYECDIPRFDGATLLKLLTGKKVLFVGDSMNRSMWVSLVCLLWQSVEDKTMLTDVRGKRAVYIKNYNCTVEFIPSVFLAHVERNAGHNETLQLDKFEQSPSTNYKDLDIIVFNTGHWWNNNKVNNGRNFFKVGDHLYDNLDVVRACKKALRTWGKWVDKNINSKRTQVFFSGYTAAHFRGGQWNSGGACDGETEPIMNDAQVGEYHWTMNILEAQLKRMKTPVYYLNITRLTDYRKDAHISVYRFSVDRNVTAEQRKIQDCSHWCIPGVPDEWNHLLYAALVNPQRLT